MTREERAAEMTQAILRLIDGFEEDNETRSNMVSSYIESALRGAESEALERAAKVAEGHKPLIEARHSLDNEFAAGVIVTRKAIAESIRALAKEGE